MSFEKICSLTGVIYLKALINLYPHLPLFIDGFSFRWTKENISAKCTPTTASLKINGPKPSLLSVSRHGVQTVNFILSYHLKITPETFRSNYRSHWNPPELYSFLLYVTKVLLLKFFLPRKCNQQSSPKHSYLLV